MVILDIIMNAYFLSPTYYSKHYVTAGVSRRKVVETDMGSEN